MRWRWVARLPVVAVAGVAAVFFSARQASAAPVGVTTIVAVSGDTPSRGAGVVFLLRTPVLNNSGKATFEATRYTTNGFIVGGGIFRGDGKSNPRTLDVIVLQGDPTPDINGYQSGGSITGLYMNNHGEVAFATHLDGTLGGGLDSQAIYRGNGGPLTQIARANQLVPGGDGRMQAFVYPRSLNNSGQVAFSAWLYNTSGGQSDDKGLYRGDGTNLTEIARTGRPAPGGQSTFISLNPHGFSINESGQVLFGGGERFDGTNQSVVGFHRGDGNSAVALVRDGDPTPSGNGTFFGSFYLASGHAFNDAGKIAFAALLLNSDLGFGDMGIFRGDEHNMVEIARKGDFVPDNNGRFLAFHVNIALNNQDQVLFLSSISGAAGGATAGIFVGDGANTTAIARINDPAPGGGRFSGFNEFMFALNHARQAVFYATIDLENGGPINDRFGLFFYDPVLGLFSIARQGDQLANVGQITAIQFEGGLGSQGEENSGFNDHGQVAYQCTAGGNHVIAIWSLPAAVRLSSGYDPVSAAMTISWPSDLTNWVLETSSNPVDPQSWLPSGAGTIITNSQFRVTIPASREREFFRLRQNAIP